MRWRGRKESGNVEDYRGRSTGMGGGVKFGGGAIVALVAAYFLGVDPALIMGLLGGGQSVQVEPPPEGGVQQTGGADDESARFVAVVLGSTEEIWTRIFAAGGSQYEPPKLALFRNQIGTQCGAGQAAMGPFYCPPDRKVYIDLGFFEELQTRFKAPGDFAVAYVVAHEVGHHVQTLLGTSEQVQAQRSRASEEEANALSVRQELQADCYAGVWAHGEDATFGSLEPGDVEEALGAASAVGDDTLQRSTRGVVVPESFTHGSAEQRQRWFRRGLDTGKVDACDTFQARTL